MRTPDWPGSQKMLPETLLALRTFWENHLDVHVRAWNNVDRDQFSDTLRRSGSGVGRSLHGSDVPAHHHRDVAATDDFFSYESDFCRFDHRVSSLDGSDQSLGLYHTEGIK